MVKFTPDCRRQPGGDVVEPGLEVVYFVEDREGLALDEDSQVA